MLETTETYSATTDLSQELPLLRRLAVAVWESRVSGNPETVARLLAEWCELVQWGKGGDLPRIFGDLPLEVAVDLKDSKEPLGIASISPIERRDRRKNARQTPDRRRGPRTWMSPYYFAYKTVYGEPPTSAVVKMTVRVIRALENQFGADETLKRFRNYLSVTPAKFYAAARFAERFVAFKDGGDGMRDPKAPHGYGANGKPIPSPLPGETPDQYAERLARLGF